MSLIWPRHSLKPLPWLLHQDLNWWNSTSFSSSIELCNGFLSLSFCIQINPIRWATAASATYRPSRCRSRATRASAADCRRTFCWNCSPTRTTCCAPTWPVRGRRSWCAACDPTRTTSVTFRPSTPRATASRWPSASSLYGYPKRSTTPASVSPIVQSNTALSLSAQSYRVPHVCASDFLFCSSAS